MKDQNSGLPIEPPVGPGSVGGVGSPIPSLARIGNGKGRTSSVSGDTHPIPSAQEDAADESGGVLSVSGDTHPIPAKAAATTA